MTRPIEETEHPEANDRGPGPTPRVVPTVALSVAELEELVQLLRSCWSAINPTNPLLAARIAEAGRSLAALLDGGEEEAS